MVYCGKASQGCKNCRTRRIKCDKLRPECSQCIRVGKKCPGYRDQLSLMFRDESSKVIQKAHAQWGVGDSASDELQHSAASKDAGAGNAVHSPYTASTPSASSNSNWSTSAFLSAPLPNRGGPPTPPSPNSSRHSSTSGSTSFIAVAAPRLPTPVDPSIEEQGVQFYVNRYLIGHPDEPRTSHDLVSTEWLWSPAIQDVMMAVGLASLSNVRGDKALMTQARCSYGLALRQTGMIIQAPVAPGFEVALRSVVMLAMFELVKGTFQGITNVHAHIMGGVALLRRWCPMPEAAFGGVRAMVQLTYTLFIPAYQSGTSLPTPFLDWVTFGSSLLDNTDRHSTSLGLLIARFIQISAYIRTHMLTDGRPQATASLQQLLDAEAAFVEWEQSLGDTWHFCVEKALRTPSAAVFENEYHVYYDMFIARMWGHYRWARILVNQTIVELIDEYPMSSLPLTSTTTRDDQLQIIQRLARDVLVSTPSHWRHPLLDDKSVVPVIHPGGAGSGSAGIPVVLFHLRDAACAPGVPISYWKWALNVMDCIWSDLGMIHAKAMAEDMRSFHDKRTNIKVENIEESLHD